MTLADTFVTAREAVLNLVLGVDSDHVLNAASASGNRPVSGVEVAAEMKRAVNAFKGTAITADGSRVNYGQLRRSEAYAAYRKECTPLLRRLDLAALASREERLAFWINLYNTLVIDAVIALGVERSITEGRAGLLAFYRRAAYNVGGYRFSCDDIEHGILRENRGTPLVPGPQFGPSDPRRRWVVSPPDLRIHFALNCASRSCPPIGVYDAGSIDAQLDLATANFLSDQVEVDPVQGEVRLSKIFQWYAGDFGGPGGVITFLLQHLPAAAHCGWLASHQNDVTLIYRSYDWTLNHAT